MILSFRRKRALIPSLSGDVLEPQLEGFAAGRRDVLPGGLGLFLKGRDGRLVMLVIARPRRDPRTLDPGASARSSRLRTCFETDRPYSSNSHCARLRVTASGRGRRGRLFPCDTDGCEKPRLEEALDGFSKLNQGTGSLMFSGRTTFSGDPGRFSDGGRLPVSGIEFGGSRGKYCRSQRVAEGDFFKVRASTVYKFKHRWIFWISPGS